MGNREIKFRTFKNGMMSRSFKFGEAICFPDGSVSVGRNFELMQYTGLKDANGVDIYEGDIVKMWYAPMATCNGFIESVDGCFVFNTKQATPNIASLFACANDYGNSLSVIGNIYQNPELLNS